MKKGQELANRLREVILDGTWIANTNFKDQIEFIDWTVAEKRVESFNTISEIAQHVHYFIYGIKNVFITGKLEIKDQFSFEFPAIQSQNEWMAFQGNFWKDTEKLAEILEKISEEQLNKDFVDKKYGNYLRNIDGLIEHCYYHLGQIVLLKKIINK
ncbi:hypothetical protein [Robiginitalea biformata]|uniref:DUF1572 domain-containing protein n=1 Tax=Robiginitalea biformata (strain ATCC BAA-864 / DSM 15991 / KCTC 12146 / HTCC2501) TaxID=313596 RepID=A4CN58_ROBBH|nr:hypothetical protein [Robiginitalea biformata]EAR15100.1 hypothetical protein RB2501_12257 [Robiginitalea biformata HTCC2501]